ncbi:hypothetical protein LXL04_025125, partial [Taraxacum kok-saghyz]
MGTKRAFDEDLQDFIEHPKHVNYGNKSGAFSDVVRKHFRTDESENVVTVPYMFHKDFNTTAPLPLVTGITTHDSDSDSDSDSGSVPVFNPNLFSEFLQYNFPSQKLFFNDNLYSSLLNRPPRKAIPVGPDHQANVPEFNSEVARIYKTNSGMERFLGFCVIGIPNSDGIHHSDSGYSSCECLDGGSIRCVQQHVKEARMKLMEYFGSEKFVDLGMGEEVASKWSEEEERVFHEIVYSNTESVGNTLWKELSVAFPFRKTKELVSYYFNVFILRRRAVQNRKMFLEIDSDDDEWRESYGGSYGEVVEDDDFVVGGCGHEDVSENGGFGNPRVLK